MSEPDVLNSANSTIDGQGDVRHNPRGAGRKKDPDAVTFKSVGFRPSEWEWLALWSVGKEKPDNPTVQLREVVERSRKFWPDGPDKGPRHLDAAEVRKARLSPSVGRAAARRGMEKSEYINRACAAYEASQKEGNE